LAGESHQALCLSLLFIIVPACIAVHFIDVLWFKPAADRQGVFNDLAFHSMTSAIRAEGALSSALASASAMA
jgi:hypothetical protein